MPSLPPIIPIFAANTNLGKTVVSAALVVALTEMKKSFRYIKPVQTGMVSDATWVQTALEQGRRMEMKDRFITMHSWPQPVSPHLAASLNRDVIKIPSSENLAQEIATLTQQFRDDVVIVETAGGVLSPSPDGTLQADVFAMLRKHISHVAAGRRMPCILVGDAKLGGISSTLCALQCLEARQMVVAAILLLANEESHTFGVGEFLQQHLKKQKIQILQLDGFPSDVNVPLTEFFHSHMNQLGKVLKAVETFR